METIITRGETAEQSSVRHVFDNDIETDETLLSGWNMELNANVDPVTRLDPYHMLWYKFNQTGNILCMFEHFDKMDAEQDFDQRILVSMNSNMLTYHDICLQLFTGTSLE